MLSQYLFYQAVGFAKIAESKINIKTLSPSGETHCIWILMPHVSVIVLFFDLVISAEQKT